jgi:isocitrate dehydrogenase (NAD+)
VLCAAMLRQAGSKLLGSLSAESMPAAASFATQTIAPFTATLFPGDGVGPEIADAVQKVFIAAKVPVTWDVQHISKTVDPRTNSMVTRENLDSVKVSDQEQSGGGRVGLDGGQGAHARVTASTRRHHALVRRRWLPGAVQAHNIGLKGPMATPIGKGFRSLNLTLRKELDLYANVRPCFSIPGYKTRYDGVNIVTVRENTEGEYSGLEHEVVPGVVESLKVRCSSGVDAVGAVHASCVCTW